MHGKPVYSTSLQSKSSLQCAVLFCVRQKKAIFNDLVPMSSVYMPVCTGRIRLFCKGYFTFRTLWRLLIVKVNSPTVVVVTLSMYKFNDMKYNSKKHCFCSITDSICFTWDIIEHHFSPADNFRFPTPHHALSV